MLFAPALSIHTAAVFNYRLIDIVMGEAKMEVEETVEEAAAEPMEDDEDDMSIDVSSELALTDDEIMHEELSMNEQDISMRVDEPKDDDVAMSNTDEEIDSLASMLRGMHLNEGDVEADITQTMRDMRLNEDDITKEITNRMATMELNGKRKTTTTTEETDEADMDVSPRASKRGGFWFGPPRFNIGMAPPKELRCSRHRHRHRRSRR